jgi:hypothetical protein
LHLVNEMCCEDTDCECEKGVIGVRLRISDKTEHLVRII